MFAQERGGFSLKFSENRSLAYLSSKGGEISFAKGNGNVSFVVGEMHPYKTKSKPIYR